MKEKCSHSGWIRRIWQRIEGINGFLLILYTTFVFASYAFLVTPTYHYFIRWVIFLFALSCFVCPVLLRWLRKVDFSRKETLETEAEKGKRELRWKLACFLIPFGVFLMKYLIYYPGSFSPDSWNQYGQVISGQYNDWHPVFQTILSFWVPLTISGGWLGSIVLLQIIFFAAAIGYCLWVLRGYTSGKIAGFALAFIVLNPNISNLAMYPWKDTAFAVGAVLLTAFAMRAYFTRGEWLKNPWHCVALTAALAATTLVRHNGMLFTIPMAIAIFCQIGIRRAAVIAVCAAALVVGVKGPVYSALRVEAPGERQIEMLGMPMVIIGASAKYAPEKLDEETREFVNKIAPQEVWNFYEYGNYNNVKWYGADNQVIEEYGAGRVIPMALRCFQRCPDVSLVALISLTDVVYSVCDDYVHEDLPRLYSNSYGFEQGGIPALQRANEAITRAVNVAFPWLFMYVGAVHFALIAFGLAKCRLNKWEDWKRILFTLPVFAYNWGTTLLLSDAHDSARFFMYSFMILPGLIAILGKKQEKQETQE